MFILESSGGKYVNCPAGTYNGYGYRQNKREWKCFPTQAEVVGYVKELMAERIKSMGLPTALCYYQSGHKVSNCEYYRKFLKLQ